MNAFPQWPAVLQIHQKIDFLEVVRAELILSVTL